jgi:PKD repeat protein
MNHPFTSRRSNAVFTRRLLALTTVVALGGGCSLDKQPAPSLAGPSELALSLAITADPDIITQDGRSTTMIKITARDVNGQPPRPPLQLRAETMVNGVLADFGVLSSRTVSTGNNDGFASFVYQAPAAPPPTATSDNIVTVVITPVGTNYGDSTPRNVVIRLARPNNPFPNAPPVPRFFFSPTNPSENEDVLFDASASTDDGRIVTYAWNFGDGDTAQGARVFHDYALAGAYKVSLTVTDDLGATATTPLDDISTVTVGAAANPTASFVSSPAAPRAGATVNFSAAGSTTPTGRTIVSYAWNFGDGSVGAGLTPTHVYGVANAYTVSLTVTDNTGRKHTATGVVTVVP